MRISNPFDDWKTEDALNTKFRRRVSYARPPAPEPDFVERYVPQPDGSVHLIIENERIAILWPIGQEDILNS